MTEASVVYVSSPLGAGGFCIREGVYFLRFGAQGLALDLDVVKRFLLVDINFFESDVSVFRLREGFFFILGERGFLLRLDAAGLFLLVEFFLEPLLRGIIEFSSVIICCSTHPIRSSINDMQ